ncbi:MAG: MFS transporter [Lysobacteraceae bacterium]|nr:MAG: MFS transporter [Xanthomonadaceae bacterium]
MPEAERRIHHGETAAVAGSFLYFFCILTAYYMVRPVREQLSGAVGSTQLPWFYAATFVATLALTPIFAWLIGRYPRRYVVPGVYLFFIACLLGFVPLFTHEGLLSPRALGTVFFVWVSVFNLFVVAVFWSFMADIWSDRQARRLFPVIGLGGATGAIFGPALASLLVGEIGVAPLLVVSSMLLGVAMVCVWWLGRWSGTHGARAKEPGHGAAVGGGMFDGLRQVFADPFTRGMAIMLLLGDAIGTINYALVADYSGKTFTDAVDRTRFYANLDLLTNLLQIVVQVSFTRWLLLRHGAAPVIALKEIATILVLLLVVIAADPYAAISGVSAAEAAAHSVATPEQGMIAAFFTGLIHTAKTLPWVALALLVSRGLAYGMVGPARESLFACVPRSQRYKGKNAVDTAVWRFGDLSVALSMNVLREAKVVTAGFAGIALLASAASGVIGWRLARRVEREYEQPAAQAATSTA